jgi:hypothetical protein
MTDQWWSSARQPPGAVPYRNKFDAARDPLSARVALGAAALDSPVFVGDPQAPTPPAGDNDQSIATTEWVTAAAGVTVHNHCGRLEYVSATALSFRPYNGDRIKINGSIYAIPSGGITLTNSGLTANTLYYVYVLESGGTIAGEFSTTGHATSTTAGNVGTEIKSGDNTRTLIGMVYTNASSQFQYTADFRGVINWFNRRNIALTGSGTGGASTTSTTAVELTTAARAYFLSWAEEAVHGGIIGVGIADTASAICTGSALLDGATVMPAFNQFTAFTAGAQGALGALHSFAVSEGFHYLTPSGAVTAGTGVFYLTITGMLRG